MTQEAKDALYAKPDGSVDPEIQKVINENFFDMLDGEEVHCKGVGQLKESTGKLAELIKEFEELPCEEKIRRICDTRVEMEKEAWFDKAWDWIEDNLLTPNQQDKSRLYFEQFKNYLEGE